MEKTSTVIVSKSEERMTKQETQMAIKYINYFRALKKCKFFNKTKCILIHMMYLALRKKFGMESETRDRD